MNLIDKEVTHKVFGEGSIVDQDDSFITIKFDDNLKKFVYPDVFGTFIKLHDRDLAETLDKVIVKRVIKEEKIERKREETRERDRQIQTLKNKLKKEGIHESSQIVFWIDEEEKEVVFNQWNIFAGQVKSGKNKGNPSRVARLRPNSATLLTSRDSDQDEIERRIHGLYMVSETFAGNESDDGTVPSHETYRIELTDEESEKMLFWNYYLNKSYPHRTTWNSGRYRYYDNIWTAQILKDIIALRTDEEEIKAAELFLEHFCDMNDIEIEDIPMPAGALKQ